MYESKCIYKLYSNDSVNKVETVKSENNAVFIQ